MKILKLSLPAFLLVGLTLTSCEKEELVSNEEETSFIEEKEVTEEEEETESESKEESEVDFEDGGATGKEEELVPLDTNVSGPVTVPADSVMFNPGGCIYVIMVDTNGQTVCKCLEL